MAQRSSLSADGTIHARGTKSLDWAAVREGEEKVKVQNKLGTSVVRGVQRKGVRHGKGGTRP